KIDDAIERGVRVRLRDPSVRYHAFADMSGGSLDDACLAIAHRATDGRAVLDLLVNQGQPAPFNPLMASARFARVLKEWGLSSVIGDAYAGLTFQSAFAAEGIAYAVSDLTKSEIYQAIEAPLNAGNIVLLDEPKLESELLGLIWRNNKIDHPNGPAEHDDWANGACGALRLALHGIGTGEFWAGGERLVASVATLDGGLSHRRSTWGSNSAP